MSDCSACIGLDFSDCDGHAEFSNTETPKARKPHKCGECERLIAVGEIYERTSGKFDGEIYTDKTCLECADIRDGFTCEARPMPGQLWDEMRDYVFPYLNESCYDKLTTVAAKKFLRDRWMKWKGLAA